MNRARSSTRRAAIALAVATVLFLPATAAAQAWTYPSFQPPQVVEREYNFGVADGGDGGTSLLFQWREGFSPVSQLSLDIGIADPEFGDAYFLLGGAYGRQLMRANAEMPLDLLFTAGAYAALGDNSIFRIPVGLSVGHRFPLEGQLAITPYVHPRVAVDVCTECGTGGDSDAEVNASFDLGVNFEVTRQLSLRFAAAFGELDEDGFGFSVAWRPRGLRASR